MQNLNKLNFHNTRLPTSQAQHAPADIYTSEEIYRLEKERIFMKEWLCVGREEEIPNVGDYMATKVLDEPVLVVRQDPNTIVAMSNVCAHRGVELVFGKGNKKMLNCPFHGWTYGLDGRLIGAPGMREAENFELAKCSLPKIRLERWMGWIFINFDDKASPLAAHLKTFEEDFAYLRQQDCRLAIQTVSEVNCNWKLVVENLIDFYHLNVVHTTTNGRRFKKEAFKFSTRSNGGYVSEYNSGPATFSGVPVFGPIPWLADRPENFSVSGLLPPNFTLFARIDTIHPYIIWPLGVDRSRVIVYTLLPEIYFNEPQFSERVVAYQECQARVVDEDRAMLESVQAGLRSTRYQPGRMAPIEKGVQQVLSGYIDRMFPGQ